MNRTYHPNRRVTTHAAACPGATGFRSVPSGHYRLSGDRHDAVGAAANRRLRRTGATNAILMWSLLGMSVCLLAMASGCSRPFWREQAERDSYDATAENITDPRWAVPRIDITPDPRSRFYDPYDPDYMPLPPDDPDAHVYMHWVDGWHGYNCWHQFGDLLSVENPQWLLPFNLSPEQYDP
jgi:hypothetical protein